MTIHSGILKKHGKKYIVMDGNQTLNNAIQRFQEGDYRENDTYLVVSLPGKQYLVSPFSELAEILQMMGPDSLIQPLSTLPIPDATWVEHVNTEEPGIEIVNRVRSRPGSTLVVIDDEGFVGLLVNIEMAGGAFGKIVWSRLHGETAPLGKDYRAAVKAKVPPRTCPHCQAQIFYQYDVAQKVYTCPNCGEVVEKR